METQNQETTVGLYVPYCKDGLWGFRCEAGVSEGYVFKHEAARAAERMRRAETGSKQVEVGHE